MKVQGKPKKIPKYGKCVRVRIESWRILTEQARSNNITIGDVIDQMTQHCFGKSKKERGKR